MFIKKCQKGLNLKQRLKAIVSENQRSEALRLWRGGGKGEQVRGGRRNCCRRPEAALEQVEGGEDEGGGRGEVAREHPPTLDWSVHIISTDSHPIVQMEKHDQPLVEGKPQWMGKDLSDGEEGPMWQWKAGK